MGTAERSSSVSWLLWHTSLVSMGTRERSSFVNLFFQQASPVSMGTAERSSSVSWLLPHPSLVSMGTAERSSFVSWLLWHSSSLSLGTKVRSSSLRRTAGHRKCASDGRRSAKLIGFRGVPINAKCVVPKPATHSKCSSGSNLKSQCSLKIIPSVNTVSVSFGFSASLPASKRRITSSGCSSNAFAQMRICRWSASRHLYSPILNRAWSYSPAAASASRRASASVSPIISESTRPAAVPASASEASGRGISERSSSSIVHASEHFQESAPRDEAQVCSREQDSSQAGAVARAHGITGERRCGPPGRTGRGRPAARATSRGECVLDAGKMVQVTR